MHGVKGCLLWQGFSVDSFYSDWGLSTERPVIRGRGACCQEKYARFNRAGGTFNSCVASQSSVK